jgi:hypothetical protein
MVRRHKDDLYLWLQWYMMYRGREALCKIVMDYAVSSLYSKVSVSICQKSRIDWGSRIVGVSEDGTRVLNWEMGSDKKYIEFQADEE